MESFDCANYRFVAFVDWIELRLTLQAQTQARYLRAKLPDAWAGGGEAPFVQAAGGQRSTTDTVFNVRVQDPRSALSVSNDLRRLSEWFPFALPPQIVGIEVGIDARPIHQTGDAFVAETAELLNRALAHPVSDNRRITGPKGTRGLVTSATEHRRKNVKAMRDGYSIFIGNKGDAVTQRVYAKDLTTNLARARYEVTLTGPACPVTSIDTLATFDFSKLSGLFKWRRINPKSRVPQCLQERPTTLTRPNQAVARAKHKRMHLHGTVADTDLGYAAVNALRKLTRAQRKGWAPRGAVPNASSENLTKPAPQVIDSYEDHPLLLNTKFKEEQEHSSTICPPTCTASSRSTTSKTSATPAPAAFEHPTDVLSPVGGEDDRPPASTAVYGSEGVGHEQHTSELRIPARASAVSDTEPCTPYADTSSNLALDAVFPAGQEKVL